MTAASPGGKVLVCRTDAIGDLVLTTPLFQALHDAWPDTKIHALVSAQTKPILRNNPCIHTIHTDSNDNRALRTLLHEQKFDSAIVVRPELRLAWTLWRAGVPLRIGTSRRAYSVFFNAPVSISRKQGGKHESEYNLELLTPFGWNDTAPWAKVYVSEEDRELAAELLVVEGLDPKHPYVVVHPGSRGSAPNLPYDTYASLVSRLTKHVPVVLTGSEEETMPLLRRLGLSEDGGLGVFNLAGKTTLRALIGLLAGAERVVASSTGPLHLAAAVGTKVVSFYGHYRPISAERWRPWVPKEQIRLVNPDTEHCPSGCKGKCGRDGCLATLKAETILKAVLP